MLHKLLSDTLDKHPSSTSSTANPNNTTAQPTGKPIKSVVNFTLHAQGSIPDVINALQNQIAELQSLQMQLDALGEMMSFVDDLMSAANRTHELAQTLAREHLEEETAEKEAEQASDRAEASEGETEEETSEQETEQESDHEAEETEEETSENETEQESDHEAEEEAFKEAAEMIQDALEQGERANTHHNDEDSIRRDVEGMGLHGLFGGAGTSLRTSTPASSKDDQKEKEEHSCDNSAAPPPSLS